MWLPGAFLLWVAGIVIAHMVLIGCHNGQSWNSGRVEQIFSPHARVLLHDLPFFFIQFSRFAKDIGGDKHLTNIVQHGGNANVVKQLPFNSQNFCLGQIEHADIG